MSQPWTQIEIQTDVKRNIFTIMSHNLNYKEESKFNGLLAMFWFFPDSVISLYSSFILKFYFEKTINVHNLEDYAKFCFTLTNSATKKFIPTIKKVK